MEFFGNTFCILVTEDKWTEVWSWGSASSGQLGLGPTVNNVSVPTSIEDLGG